MSYNFSLFNLRTAEIEDWLKKEFSSIRTGKASPLLLDGVMVESFGSRVPIKHIATIVTEDAKTLRITPWDRNHVKNIEGAIATANLGVSTAPDSTGIRVIFPDLTSERRLLLAKAIKEKLEEGKVSIRKEREKIIIDIEEKTKNKEISEDDRFQFKDDLQKIVENSTAKLTSLAEAKEKEINL
ncbi:MAG: ribosome recycling factor [Candidatus Vogelbacteria bacterium RIFOXYD1_FULL_44_32]|uniref:Ribosome recycling factor n=1 Tax=Candidatus Vogelbacteria bacterium RIFOXYD1_FULL_44_32 TaxID=1802438 RepID=A0A1G2QE09_9BACT|nr:MAG: ribosome recycling factor [Candidatus Vogelbacteria bacterium RIFOXYD1_FULL_44_32]